MADLKLLKSGYFSVLAWDARNRLFAAYDEEEKTVRVFDVVDGHETYRLNIRPCAMCFDLYGRLLACDAEEKALIRNDYYGPIAFAREFHGNATEPKSILIHSSGTYFLLGSKRLYHVIPEGRGVLDACDSKDLVYSEMCISKNEEGLIFIRKDNKRIVFGEFDSMGKPLKEKVLVFGTEFGDEIPRKIVTDQNGNIYCAAGEKLYIFNEYGKTIDIVRCGRIGGMCYAPEDNLVLLSLPNGIYGLEVNK